MPCNVGDSRIQVTESKLLTLFLPVQIQKQAGGVMATTFETAQIKALCSVELFEGLWLYLVVGWQLHIQGYRADRLLIFSIL